MLTARAADWDRVWFGQPAFPARAARSRGDAAVVALAYGAGLRSAEIAAVRARDVRRADDGQALVRVGPSKTDQSGRAADTRSVPVRLAPAVLDLAARRPPAARLVGPRSPSQIRRRFRSAVRLVCDRPRLSSHSGRIGMASDMAADGRSDAAIMLAGGWKSPATMRHYASAARAEDVGRLRSGT